MDQQDKDLMRAALTVQKVQGIASTSALVGFLGFGGLFLWLTYDGLGQDNPFYWILAGVGLALVGAFVVPRVVLTLLSR